MKKLLSGILIGIIIGSCLTFFVTTENLPQVQADCQDTPCLNPPCCNGDVNGDGAVDISDAVYLLNYLFSNSAQPTGVERILATGQTQCFDKAGRVVACDSSEFPGQDGFYQKGCPSNNRFLNNGDNTVTDTFTGLMWQRNTANTGEDKLTWMQALQFCEDLEFAGYKDWRLPNVRELSSIVNYNRANQAINSVFVVGSHLYWTSSTNMRHLNSPELNEAWVVSFLDGTIQGSSKGTDTWDGPRNDILAVRSIGN